MAALHTEAAGSLTARPQNRRMVSIARKCLILMHVTIRPVKYVS